MATPEVWSYALLSVLVISLISLVGALGVGLTTKKLKHIILLLVSFSGGALFADAFIHLLPEVVEQAGFGLSVSFSVLAGIIVFFIVEKFIHWHHCHLEPDEHEHHHHPFAYMNLLGDAVHNLIDGIIIGASYLVSIPAGIATTIAVALHEIPQEIGDFGVLVHGGFSIRKALLVNFLVSATSIAGAVLSLILASYLPNLTLFLVPFAAGGFIYIAGSDLIPELHKEVVWYKSTMQLATFLLGILVMYALVFVE